MLYKKGLNTVNTFRNIYFASSNEYFFGTNFFIDRKNTLPIKESPNPENFLIV